jgi:hypothetical protein
MLHMMPKKLRLVLMLAVSLPLLMHTWNFVDHTNSRQAQVSAMHPLMTPQPSPCIPCATAHARWHTLSFARIDTKSNRMQ